jgi:DNA invertase Pin-like site-specific DNA recombinase
MHLNKLINIVKHISVYTRVSTGKQSTDLKMGLETQRELCNSFIEKHYTNHKIDIKYYSDIGSSYKTNKTLADMKQMIYKLDKNTLILIFDVSRLGRSNKMIMPILKTIKSKNSFVLSVSEKLIYGQTLKSNKLFLEKVNESKKMSDLLSIRTREIQTYIKKRGGYVGKPPFGYKIIKNSQGIPILAENKEEFKLIDEIVKLGEKYKTYKEIAEEMNNKNLLHKNKLWTHYKIKIILHKFYPEHKNINILIENQIENQIEIENENENENQNISIQEM